MVPSVIEAYERSKKELSPVSTITLAPTIVFYGDILDSKDNYTPCDLTPILNICDTDSYATEVFLKCIGYELS